MRRTDGARRCTLVLAAVLVLSACGTEARRAALIADPIGAPKELCRRLKHDPFRHIGCLKMMSQELRQLEDEGLIPRR